MIISDNLNQLTFVGQRLVDAIADFKKFNVASIDRLVADVFKRRLFKDLDNPRPLVAYLKKTTQPDLKTYSAILLLSNHFHKSNVEALEFLIDKFPIQEDRYGFALKNVELHAAALIALVRLESSVVPAVISHQYEPRLEKTLKKYLGHREGDLILNYLASFFLARLAVREGGYSKQKLSEMLKEKMLSEGTPISFAIAKGFNMPSHWNNPLRDRLKGELTTNIEKQKEALRLIEGYEEYDAVFSDYGPSANRIKTFLMKIFPKFYFNGMKKKREAYEALMARLF